MKIHLLAWIYLSLSPVGLGDFVFATDCTSVYPKLVRQNPLNGGFAEGISVKELEEIAQSLSTPLLPIAPLPGKSFEQVLINASYRNSFWEKIGVVIRDIAGSHLLNDGNHRMAFQVAKRLIERNGIVRSPSNTDEKLYFIISKVARKAPGYRTPEEIAAHLRGF
ncbi:hypothetical protein EBR78_10395 [bacterium]|nr:hypothetical protein [bacterium]